MPKSAVSCICVDTAATCCLTTSVALALIEDVSQSLTVLAFMIVSAVVKDLLTTTTNVEDASTPSTCERRLKMKKKTTLHNL
jgi:hypothetical protein